ncbi:hypothetical protein AUP68_14034 [Ilyonectria robusta]
MDQLDQLAGRMTAENTDDVNIFRGTALEAFGTLPFEKDDEIKGHMAVMTSNQDFTHMALPLLKVYNVYTKLKLLLHGLPPPPGQRLPRHYRRPD